MTVKTGGAWAGTFVTKDATGALATPTTGPAGTLYVDGTANGATVTITGSNPYKWAVTLPSLTAGQRVDMYITATIATIATAAVVASDQADTALVSEVKTDTAAILLDTGTDGVIVASIANDAITAAAIKTDAITEIQNGLALEATLTAIKGAGWSTETLAAIDVLIDAIKAKTDTIPASPAAVGSAMTLADDAITSAKFDESTAFPLKSADTGSTKVARTGADSDTLETLSDQIDTIDSSGVASAVDTLLSTNHGSGAWGSAGNGGSLTLTYTVSKSTGGVLEGATVKLYSDSNRTTLVNTKISNVLGQVIFTNLVAGTYYLTTTCSGYEDMLDSEVVA